MKKLVKYLTLTVILFVSAIAVFAQNANLYPFHFTTVARVLPKQILPEDKRTYSIRPVNGTGIDINFNNDIKVNGFTPVENNGVVKLIIAFPHELRITGIEIISTVDPARAATGGKFYNGKRVVETDGKITVECADDAGYKHYDLQPFKREFYTKQYTTEADARKEAVDAESAWMQTAKEEFKKFAVNKANFKINMQYGFAAIATRVNLWRIESEKHPEFQNFKDNCTLVKTIFADVTQELIPADSKTKLQPAISYFESVPKLFSESDKKHKKMRYAAYYNLMKIYFHLDDFEAASKYAVLLVENDYDERDGKKMLEEITSAKEKIQKSAVTSLHFKMGEQKDYTVYRNE